MLYTEIVDPVLQKDRMESALPMWTKSITESEEPTRCMPYKDRVDPSLAYDRTEKLDAILNASWIDNKCFNWIFP
jgi:hypothetical protein